MNRIVALNKILVIHYTTPSVIFNRFLFFFFNDTATTEIYTLSLHDALPIFGRAGAAPRRAAPGGLRVPDDRGRDGRGRSHRALDRSEEHTSELQSPYEL